jgi:hypothetical protein
MVLTRFEAIVASLAALVTVCSVIAVGLRWVYKQGVASADLVGAIKGNTEATGTLSAAFDRFTEKTGQTLTDHEHRITRVEDRFMDLHDDVRAGRKGEDANVTTR